ncbi:MAG: hydroxymethylglutaryl-CoA synthase family protein [Mycobacterium sp.]|nr:hydroxymethylglutaryl-CoA synthase family protein [Mycobacterium sp.]
MTSKSVGIEAINVYCGFAQISVPVLFEGRGLDSARIANLMMDQRSVQLPFEDPVTNAVNAAKALLESLDQHERDEIGLLVTSTESGLDYSKSIASFAHGHLGLSRHCRLLEVKHACYGTSAMVQLAAGYLASEGLPQSKALIIATDVTVVDGDHPYAEPATGFGAVAVLISDQPNILALDRTTFGNYGFDTMDAARPTPTLELWDPDQSLLTYIECLKQSYQHYAARVPAADFVASFDRLAFHTPFAGLIKSVHRTMMRAFARRPAQEIDEDFQRRVLPSLTYPRIVGNLFSGSVYLALCSSIETAPDAGGKKIGMYSYGSGCSSEFYSGRIHPEAPATLATMRISDRLRSRRELTFPEYARILDQTHECLVPKPEHKVDLAEWSDFLDSVPGRTPALALSNISNYQRQYEWI